jgi:hypothetical protein
MRAVRGVVWSVTVLLAGMTSACETAIYSIEWTKPGMDAQQYRRDAYECGRDARMSSSVNERAGSSVRQTYMRCMEGRGYTLVK